MKVLNLIYMNNKNNYLQKSIINLKMVKGEEIKGFRKITSGTTVNTYEDHHYIYIAFPFLDNCYVNTYEFTRMKLYKERIVKVNSQAYDWYLNVRDELINLIKFHYKDVIVIGHSFGALMASICYLDIISNLNILQLSSKLFISGPVKLGDKEFCNAIELKENCMRLIHRKDIIPKLFKFKDCYHAGKEIKIGKGIFKNKKYNHIDCYIKTLIKELENKK